MKNSEELSLENPLNENYKYNVDGFWWWWWLMTIKFFMKQIKIIRTTSFCYRLSTTLSLQNIVGS